MPCLAYPPTHSLLHNTAESGDAEVLQQLIFEEGAPLALVRVLRARSARPCHLWGPLDSPPLQGLPFDTCVGVHLQGTSMLRTQLEVTDMNGCAPLHIAILSGMSAHLMMLLRGRGGNDAQLMMHLMVS